RGWHGPVAHVALAPDADRDALVQALLPYPPVANLKSAIVTATNDKSCDIYIDKNGQATLKWKQLKWASGKYDKASQFLKPGDVIYVSKKGKHWQLSEIPKLQSALVALDPYDGAIVALDGGFSFALSKF